MAKTVVHYALQPVLLIATVWASVSLGAEAAYTIVGPLFVIVLIALEWWMPARPEWVPTGREFGRTLGIVAVALACGAGVTAGYQALSPAFESWRAARGLDQVWPTHWPLALQILAAFFTTEFFWYWLHRAEHRSPLFWRMTGHGAHHSFHKLGALHLSANHPFELLVLLLPSALLELLFGASEAALGASVLLATNAAIAHANLDLNSRGIDWFFTTNRHHIHHHSRVREESNTNYACAAMLWDRVFGTYVDADTVATGIGPREPTVAELAWMPFREPAGTAVAPGDAEPVSLSG